MIDITGEDLATACRDVYGNWLEHAPRQVFIDQFKGEPATTFLRASFPEKFTHAAACKLDRLRKLLHDRHGDGNIVFVCYYAEIDPLEMARRSIEMADR
jgi:hypothetical protein